MCAALLLDGQNVDLVTNAVRRQCLSTERGARLARQVHRVRRAAPQMKKPIPPRLTPLPCTVRYKALPGRQTTEDGDLGQCSNHCLHRNLKITESWLEGQPQYRIQDSGFRIQGSEIMVVAWFLGKGYDSGFREVRSWWLPGSYESRTGFGMQRSAWLFFPES
jgi:hypothetical protein